jgi:serine/threonine protein kinase
MPDFGERWKALEREPVGGGGQARVYRVRDAQTEAVCAAKVLNAPKCDATSARWKRIEAEIEVAKTFDHCNVIRVLDAGHTSGSGYPFYVMPFYKNGSLAFETWRSSGPIMLLQRFAEICDGVAHVHSKEAIHHRIQGHPCVLDVVASVALLDVFFGHDILRHTLMLPPITVPLFT